MLRNQQKSKQMFKNLLFLKQQQQRFIQQLNTIVCNKNTSVIRQGKIMGKLFGHRVSGSKKRWFPSTINATQAVNPSVMFKKTQFTKTSNEGGKNVTRRMAVLNKLFMEHITDLMATGEISESILGKGLQISRVKISQDFAYVSVHWLSSGDVSNDTMLENELSRCSGVLRHELSQLCLMGVVPRIQFVKDKLFSNINQVEALLKNMDFGSHKVEHQEELYYQSKHEAATLKEEFYGIKANNSFDIKPRDVEENTTVDVNLPEMRHDVLGLDHKGIMFKILTKMRKSKQAWDQHLLNTPSDFNTSTSIETSSTIPSTSFAQLAKVNEKLAKAAANSEKFELFLAQRREKRNTPERKKFRIADHNIDEFNDDQLEYPEPIFEPEDYLLDDVEDTNHK